MKVEKSCGAVVFTREGGQIRYVIIRSLTGIYGLPKGHVEAGETEEETALREVREETGLAVSLIDGFRTTDSHPFMREDKEERMKHIVYFLAEYQGQSLLPQETEISDIRLMGYEEALGSFQFESSKRILRESHSFLMDHLA